MILSSGMRIRVIDARDLRPLETTREEEQAGGIWPVYTGVVPLVYKAQRTLLVGLVNSILLAFVLICVLMMVILRSPTAGLLSMIPNVFPIVVIFGFMGWIGALIDIGTMMTASVAMGVAVDDTVHFLTWFRRRDYWRTRSSRSRTYGVCTLCNGND